MAAPPSTSATATAATSTSIAPVYLPITPKLKYAYDVALSPDNAFFLVIDDDRWGNSTVKHVDTTTNTATRTYEGFEYPRGFDISPDTSAPSPRHSAHCSLHSMEMSASPSYQFVYAVASLAQRILVSLFRDPGLGRDLVDHLGLF